MFYAQFVLSKKGPLAKIWLAAHWEKKLSKAQIYETNVDEAVDEIMKPKQNMALRTTGHLLLGIVRIYSRKTKYLLADCNEAFLKIKLAFRPGQLDEPNEPSPSSNFKIPEIFGDFDTSLPEFNEEDYNSQVSQCRLDDITLKEDNLNEYNNRDLANYEIDDFGEHAAGVTFDDDFGEFTVDFGDTENTIDFARNAASDFEALIGREREPTPCLENAHAPGNAIFGDEDFESNAGESMDDQDHDNISYDAASEVEPVNEMTTMDLEETMSIRSFQSNATTVENMFPNESMEAYLERQREKKRKRKLLVDEIKSITGEEMKQNMANYRDTLIPLDLAAPSKRLMKLRKVGTAERLFHLPGCSGLRTKALIRQYQTRLIPVKTIDRNIENSERIKELLGLGEIVDDENNFPDMSIQDNAFQDDFEEIASIDFDTIEPSSPVHIELQDDNPAPLAFGDIDDFSSPTEKKKKREKNVEEEEQQQEGDDDNRWSKRTQTVLNSIANKINHSEDEEITLTDLMTKGSTRKTAAQKFYTLLVLKKWQAIEVQQAEPYDEIFITAGPNMGQTLGQ